MNIFSTSVMQKDFFQYRSLIIAPYLPKMAAIFENSGHFESENVINEFLVPDNPIFMYHNYDTLSEVLGKLLQFEIILVAIF